MSKLLRIGLVVTALIATGIVARSAVLTSISGTDTLGVTSGTLANDVPVSVLGTYFASNTSNALIGTGVNKVSIAGAATGVAPQITVGGASSDANIGISIAGKGSGSACLGGTTCANASEEAVTVASAVNHVIDTGAATGSLPIISSGGTGSDANIGLLLDASGTGTVYLGGTTAANASVGVPGVASSVNQLVMTSGATGVAPSVVTGGTGADANIGISVAGKGTGAVLIGGSTTTLAGLQVAQTASRVNDFVLTPAATGNTPGFIAGGAGADAAVGVAFGTQGTGSIAFNTDNTVQQFGVGRTATAVDYLVCAGAATANPALVACTATGSDTNININLVTKAAGNVKLGTSTVSTCSGTTTATCQGQRFVVSITGLTTAASTLSAAMTVTNANVISSASTVMCQVNLYTGTGVPVAVGVTPGTGTVALNIQNVSTGAALNATVPIACVVFGT